MPEDRQTALGSAIREAQEWRALFDVMRWISQVTLLHLLIFRPQGFDWITGEDFQAVCVNVISGGKGLIEEIERYSPSALRNLDADFKRRIIARLESTLRQEAHFAAESGDADA
ncbi:hypothetical protein AA0242T_1359 [Acetobacter aceti NRIC 0242]|uniref:Uncharacterized protein n=1 Tax=Acetobacter aceti NBRC 14818 TaxID=887700 RepID=A0AB33II08_ACEAC|nr:hypothetical protein [Acetobacter aceti]TCS31770.1 hypothetical protein EDC15_1152 [Acetobacter aceti NBRC 14818]BCK77189.1 hypothetical protein EMQ_2795 [Acetobacter aceti NBRC 14818]GAN58875.1 hypothetical protein Abac_088_006 [Acetobacter aceti NBRC 14818]GBO80657.1 hypothetical protein AA0242T_1359 [Acetobacter aceti NRIC 0242]